MSLYKSQTGKIFEEIVKINGGIEPCTMTHLSNCILWISQRFGHKVSLFTLTKNLINISDYGHKEIFKNVDRNKKNKINYI